MTKVELKKQLKSQTYRYFAKEPLKKMPQKKMRRLQRKLIRERSS